jgi:hypothetical protein
VPAQVESRACCSLLRSYSSCSEVEPHREHPSACPGGLLRRGSCFDSEGGSIPVQTAIEGLEGWREAMSASLRRAEQRAAADEAQGDLRRRVALNKRSRFLSGDEPHSG